jgi:hypothetical protein
MVSTSCCKTAGVCALNSLRRHTVQNYLYLVKRPLSG